MNDVKLLDRVGKLNSKINYLKDELKPLQDEFNSLTSELINDYDVDNSITRIENKSFCLLITKKGYDRKNYSYKKGFENSLSKVNENTRKVLENELQKTETETFVKPKFEIVDKRK